MSQHMIQGPVLHTEEEKSQSFLAVRVLPALDVFWRKGVFFFFLYKTHMTFDIL